MKVTVRWLDGHNGGYSDKLSEERIALYLAMPVDTMPPIVIERNGQIFDGHHRFAVAKLRGLIEVDCIYREGAGRGNS